MSSPDAERLAQQILAAYRLGVFPMAMAANDPELYWFRPEMRGIIPIDGFHASRSLVRDARRMAASTRYVIDHDFAGMIDGCAARAETWINPKIRAAFIQLHQLGYAHSLSVIRDNRLIGGIYGLAIGSAFMGESMFSRAPNGSKLALWALVNHLGDLGFTLFDTQYLTDHLSSLGAIEISDFDYQKRLTAAVELTPRPLSAGEINPPMHFL